MPHGPLSQHHYRPYPAHEAPPLVPPEAKNRLVLWFVCSPLLIASKVVAGWNARDTALSQIHAGMTTNEVRASLGDPDFILKLEGNPQQWWQYRSRWPNGPMLDLGVDYRGSVRCARLREGGGC